MEIDRRPKKICPQCDTTVLGGRGTTHVTQSPNHIRGSTPPRVLHFSAFHFTDCKGAPPLHRVKNLRKEVNTHVKSCPPRSSVPGVLSTCPSTSQCSLRIHCKQEKASLFMPQAHSLIIHSSRKPHSPEKVDLKLSGDGTPFLQHGEQPTVGDEDTVK